MIQDRADADNSPGSAGRCRFARQVTLGTDFLPAFKGSAKGTQAQGQQEGIEFFRQAAVFPWMHFLSA